MALTGEPEDPYQTGTPVDPYPEGSGEIEFVMINNFLIDVSLQEDHSYESEVTDYPMESGGSVSDNIRPKPITVSMQGIVSNTPFGGITAARKGTVHSATGTTTVMARAAYFLLKQIWIDREPVTIRTSLNTFENMAMTSLSIPKSKDTGSALHFTASFQQIQVVTNKRTKVRVAVPMGSGSSQLGGQVSIERVGRQILWLKGDPNPGDDYTPFNEFLHVISRETKLPILPNQGGAQFSKWTKVLAHGNQYVPRGSDTPAKSGYTPLTAVEMAAFKKDQERDERNARISENFGGVPIGNAGMVPDGTSVYDSNGNLRANMTKAPNRSMSDLSRKTATGGLEDIGKGQPTKREFYEYTPKGKGVPNPTNFPGGL